MSEILLIERIGAVAVVTMNRPQAMNALSTALRAALNAAFVELDADETVRVVVLTGAGDRAFTAGLDLKELGQNEGAVFAAIGKDPSQNPVKAMEQCRKPIIGAVNGVAITGGFEVALACDILIAADNARFADTHAFVEVLPGWGLSQKLQRLIGPLRAKEMSLSGRFIDAETASQWGLVNRVVPAAELRRAALELAQTIATASPQMVQRYKSLIDKGRAMPLGEALEFEYREANRLNAEVDAAGIEARRRGVLDRNRQQ